MRTLRYSTQYKKDIKRYANQPEKLDALMELLTYLQRDIPVPSEYKPHRLKGEYKGCWECHVLSDLLLIWFDEKTDIVWLERIGSHSELFKK